MLTEFFKTIEQTGRVSSPRHSAAAVVTKVI